MHLAVRDYPISLDKLIAKLAAVEACLSKSPGPFYEPISAQPLIVYFECLDQLGTGLSGVR
jgi:hypothetical protein